MKMNDAAPAESAMSGFSQAQPSAAERHQAELSAALLAETAAISPKYLYDALGSKLFEAICELPEYYPTRTEAAIFSAHLAEIAASTATGATLIDLGAGNCAKAARLFPALAPRRYVPVDISADFLGEAVAGLRQRFPEIAMLALGQDFSQALCLPPEVPKERRLFFYPGSSIGNFSPEQAGVFLRQLREACDSSGGVLIGVDLVKDKAILDAAYDDALGVTAAFNLNLLAHLNRLLDANFQLRNWRHVAYFNPSASRIEMHLESLCEQSVSWTGPQSPCTRHFTSGERIHTENSYKYTREGFLRLLSESGFGQARTWTDPRSWFAVIHARAV